MSECGQSTRSNLALALLPPLLALLALIAG